MILNSTSHHYDLPLRPMRYHYLSKIILIFFLLAMGLSTTTLAENETLHHQDERDMQLQSSADLAANDDVYANWGLKKSDSQADLSSGYYLLITLLLIILFVIICFRYWYQDKSQPLAQPLSQPISQHKRLNPLQFESRHANNSNTPPWLGVFSGIFGEFKKSQSRDAEAIPVPNTHGIRVIDSQKLSPTITTFLIEIDTTQFLMVEHVHSGVTIEKINSTSRRPMQDDDQTHLASSESSS